ncbi:hypothetical protein PR048_024482 [Dryococelus australis]|uniref:Uncharacterized protein n=1 Tax=Dryococelus australis TaxID=614101 RepID=A0ABQ9GNP8_9NEOP|nr:hypothetical protein PR048_024482 [Dryococelus australis]
MQRSRGGLVVRLLTSHLGEPGSIPGGVANEFSHVGIVAAGRCRRGGGPSRGSPVSTALAFRRCSTSISLLSSSALKTPMFVRATVVLHPSLLCPALPSFPKELVCHILRIPSLAALCPKARGRRKRRQSSDAFSHVLRGGRRLSTLRSKLGGIWRTASQEETTGAREPSGVCLIGQEVRLLPHCEARLVAPSSSAGVCGVSVLCQSWCLASHPLPIRRRRTASAVTASGLHHTMKALHAAKCYGVSETSPSYLQRRPLDSSSFSAHSATLQSSDNAKHTYSEVTFTIGSQFITHALDASEPLADLQGNKQRIPYCQVWPNTGTAANEQTFEAVVHTSPAYRSLAQGNGTTPTGHLFRHWMKIKTDAARHAYVLIPAHSRNTKAGNSMYKFSSCENTPPGRFQVWEKSGAWILNVFQKICKFVKHSPNDFRPITDVQGMRKPNLVNWHLTLDLASLARFPVKAHSFQISNYNITMKLQVPEDFLCRRIAFVKY